MLGIELLQVALGVRDSLSRAYSDREWYDCFDFADKQSILGIIYHGIEKLSGEQKPGDIDLLMEWIGQTEYIKTRNLQMDRECKKLSEQLANDGFWTCIIKGQKVARRYPCPELRTSGDIDIWVLPKDIIIDGQDIIEKSRYRTLKYILDKYSDADPTPVHIDFPQNKDIPVEVHFTPCQAFNYFYDKRVQRYFEKNVDRCENGMPADVDIVFLLMHLRKHLISSGIGLRQVCDFYYTMKAFHTSVIGSHDLRFMIQVGQMENTLKHLGLYSFACGMKYVLQKVFLLDENEMICAADKMRGTFILNEIMKGGNFGRYNDDNKKKEYNNAFLKVASMYMTAIRCVRYFPNESLWNIFYHLRVAIWRRRFLMSNAKTQRH